MAIPLLVGTVNVPPSCPEPVTSETVTGTLSAATNVLLESKVRALTENGTSDVHVLSEPGCIPSFVIVDEHELEPATDVVSSGHGVHVVAVLVPALYVLASQFTHEVPATTF